MRTAASVGLLLVASTVMLALVIPLGVFFIEFVENPDLFHVETTSVLVGNEVYFNITLKYNGSVQLRDFEYTFMIGGENHTIHRNTLSSGDVIKISFSVPSSAVASGVQGYFLDFKIAGIYELCVGVRNVS